MTEFQPEGLRMDTARNRIDTGSMNHLLDAAREGRILEGRVLVCNGAHDLIVDLGCCKGIIPREEGALGIREGTTRDIALISRVNKPVCFVVTDFIRGEGGALTPILSRRAAQERCREDYLSRLRPGDILPARVTHLDSFGCFVDIGCGIPSLIPIDAISVSRISHPRDRFRTGFDIRAVVRRIEADGRISLTHKELLGTWEENAGFFQPGETVAGIIRSVEDYGTFVELTPNLAGLAEPREDTVPGQHASVYIKSLLPDRMKVKLVIVDAFDGPPVIDPPTYLCPPEVTHLDRWTYSPPNAQRLVETVFEP